MCYFCSFHSQKRIKTKIETLKSDNLLAKKGYFTFLGKVLSKYNNFVGVGMVFGFPEFSNF
ncbi:hypothetical protein MYP_1090 [Sporocytophaga myxococcoides]|uniref:Uncharacterized protein n=1 Tax=Sporocytophaga myxococcoides TaxID=153721 RepID=A0A098LBS0_9BACT|nr:hypothetical protein MYP_1090 [Sporocytophaga myxococcoides]